MGQHVVCRTSELSKGASRLVHVEGRDIAVFNLGDRFAAISNRCPHEGADLCRGKVAAFADAASPGEYTIDQDKIMVRCPWHGWEFDVETGRSYCDPNRVRVKSFEVAVEGGAKIEGNYSVEVFDVAEDGEYVVLTI